MSGISRCVLALVAVLLAGACAAQGQERIKMCGRDLIRLAVSSCGNSRMRRSSPETQPPLPSPPAAAPPAGDRVLPIQDPWGLSETTGTPLGVDQNKPIQHHNQDLKQDQDHYQNQDQEQDQRQDQDRDGDRRPDQEQSVGPPWYTVPARVIRAAGRISDVCCEKGCSMRELVQFC